MVNSGAPVSGFWERIERIFEGIRQQVGRLADYPHLGRAGRVAGTHELVIAGLPYIVAYYVKGQEARILAVMHAARKWPDEFAMS